jgi:hypothetical protein
LQFDAAARLLNYVFGLVISEVVLAMRKMPFSAK